MTSLKQATEESRQMREWLSVVSLKQAMATELWRGKMADSRCRRGGPGIEGRTPAAGGEGLASRGGLPLPEGRGPGIEGQIPAARVERAWC